VPKLLEFFDKTKSEVYLLNTIKHINVEFIFSNGKLLFFDMLSFGTLKFINNHQLLLNKLNIIGPDVMETTTTFEIFKSQLLNKNNLNKSIGVVLSNQKIISGIGNYIRSDSLWLAKINPFKKVINLTNNEIKKLLHSIKVITWGNYNRNFAINKSIINKTDKIPFDYNRDFFVYRENYDIYGNLVIKEELFEGGQKRFIYWVKNIQK